MKYSLLAVASAALLTAACGGNESTAVEAEVGEAVDVAAAPGEGVTYTVVPANSVVSWQGNKLVGDSHTGTLDVTEGSLTVAGDQITGGEFVIDMNSLENTDLDEDSGKADLEGHLKSDDFFKTEQYPTATFTVVSAEPVTGQEGITHELKGNLKMLDVTKSITIPANVTMDGDKIVATTPEFEINRTDWGVQYGSGSIAGLAQDKIINDEVQLKIELEADRA